MPALAAYFHATAAPPDPSLTARNSALHSILDNDFYPGLPDPRSIHARDVVPGIIPTYLRRDGPSPGVVVAIVLGSIAGALLVLWVLWTLTQNARTTVTGEEEIVVRRPRRNSIPIVHGGPLAARCASLAEAQGGQEEDQQSLLKRDAAGLGCEVSSLKKDRGSQAMMWLR